MKLWRPHVPISVKIRVAERQLASGGPDMVLGLIAACSEGVRKEMSATQYLPLLLSKLGPGPWHLDHEPPLMLRQRKGERYIPDANNPDYLIWRTKEAHRIKTFVRGDGAQLSDAGKRRKEIRKRKRATRPKRKWPSRPFPSRPMR
jgi:hypothetical protein